MNLTFLCRAACPELAFECRSVSSVPGEEIDISAELNCPSDFSGRVVKDVPSDRVLLLDTCWGGRLKMISDDCQFVMPGNDNEWELVKPILMELAERRVFILSEISYERPDFSEIKKKCCRSFYSPLDGALINETFAQDNLSPEKMAEAGLMFVGDAKSDVTTCYLNRVHKLRSWEMFEDPADRHDLHFFYSCIDKAKYGIPVLSDEDGQIVPVRAYKLSMESERLTRTCDEGILITHSGAPIKMVLLSEVVSKVEAASLAVIGSSLQKTRAAGMSADLKYFELLKQLISFTHFSGLLRDFECASNDFITELQRYKMQLHGSADRVTADGLLEKLKSCSVVAEVKETVNKLAVLRLVNERIIRLRFLPSATLGRFISGMEQVAEKELQELADTYKQRYFVDDFLNGLVRDGTLGCLFTGDYFNSSKRCEKLMSLLAKGTELSQVLARISEAIRGLLKPYMVDQEEPPGLHAGVGP